VSDGRAEDVDRGKTELCDEHVHPLPEPGICQRVEEQARMAGGGAHRFFEGPGGGHLGEADELECVAGKLACGGTADEVSGLTERVGEDEYLPRQVAAHRRPPLAQTRLPGKTAEVSEPFEKSDEPVQQPQAVLAKALVLVHHEHRIEEGVDGPA
jgi:hypothetical protein